MAADVSVAYISTKDKVGDSKSVYGLANGGNSSSRLGFRGEEDLGGGLKAGFWLEGGINVDDGGTGFKFDRRSTVMGNFGEVRLGRDKTPPGYQNLETTPLATPRHGWHQWPQPHQQLGCRYPRKAPTSQRDTTTA